MSASAAGIGQARTTTTTAGRVGRVRRAVGGIGAAAALAALGLGAGGPASGAGGSAPGADATPPPAVVLIPPEASPSQVLIGDDAVYAAVLVVPGTYLHADPVAVYRWPLTPVAGGGHAVGQPTLAARATGGSRVAEHDGTLAYLRATDQRIVLRASDGTLTVPSWARTPTAEAVSSP